MDLLTYNSSTKKLDIPEQSEYFDPAIKLEADQLNTLITEFIANGQDVPPPATPQTFNSDLSKMVKKLYEGGVAAFKKEKYEDSVKQFSIGIEMICRRHKFELFQGCLQELSMFLMSRTDANLKTKDFMAAYNDIDMLLSMQMCTPENFLRRGVANFFLGNYEDARADYQRGLALSPGHGRLQAELEICLDKILEENGDYL